MLSAGSLQRIAAMTTLSVWELTGSLLLQNRRWPTLSTSSVALDDPIANNDDEYAVSQYCRLDDNGADAGNEWSGAWAHSNPVEGEAGTYTFELSRLLITKSLTTDAQLAAGGTFQFGIAYWDPFQIEESGWSDSGHYLTGCASEWIDLVLKATSTGTSAPADATTLPPITAAPVVETETPVDVISTAPFDTSTAPASGTSAPATVAPAVFTASPTDAVANQAPGSATNATFPPASPPVTKTTSLGTSATSITTSVVVAMLCSAAASMIMALY